MPSLSKILPTLLAALVVALSFHAVAQHAGPPAAVAGEDDGDDGGGSSDDDGTIDCSIPDNADDTGCDTGDVQEGAPVPVRPAPAISGPVPPPAPVRPAASTPPKDTDSGPAPRGAVPTGAGGMAGHLR
jgi:hypothetical protein